MLLELHKTIQQLIYQQGNISPHEVDITFEAPTRELIDKLIRPTISLFLFDLHENTDLRQSDFETTHHNGRAERRMLPRRFDLHYMVSILTTEVEDEQQLFWRVLLTLVRHTQFPTELLSDELRGLVPALTTRVGQADEGQSLTALWTALGIPPRVALSYVVTVPVDMNRVIEAPLVFTRTTRYNHEQTAEIRHQIGGTVRNAEGTPLADIKIAIEGRAANDCQTNKEGRFTLHNVPYGTVKLRLTHTDGTQQTVTVETPPPNSATPSHDLQTYDIVLS